MQKRISQLEELVQTHTAALKEAQDQLERMILERELAQAEKERLLTAERAQARRQAALQRLSEELAATLEEAEVCWRVVRGLRETLGHALVVLFFLDETTGDRIVAAHDVYDAYELPARIKPGEGLSERPLLDGQLHYTPDVSLESCYLPCAWGSEVDVPIRIDGKVLGVLSAENVEKNAFNQDDFDVLTAAAHQTGLAIERARLLAAERQRADELDALRTTMANITAELELSSLLQAIVKRATGLLDATGGELGLYDEASQEVRIVVSHNLGEGFIGTRHALGEGVMGSVAENRQPLIIDDYLTWEARAPTYAEVQIHASVAAPLMVGGRLVGVITIASTDLTRQFTPADQHLLILFAQQAAIAIENARLFEAEQRRAEQFRVIGEVGRRITSILAVDELLGEIARLLKENLGYYLVGIGLIEGDELVFKAGAGAIWEVPGFRPPRLKVGQEGITGWVAQSGQPLLVPDLSQESRYYSLPQASEMRSELAVPLKAKEVVIGVLHVQSDCLNAYDESDVVLLQSLAHQAAIAIENARLYDQAQREINHRKKLEEELRRQKEYFEALFVHIPVAAATVNLEAKVVSWNPMAERLFGYTQEEAIGQNLDYMVADDLKIREEASNFTKQVFREGRIQATTKRTRKDGSLVEVEVLALPVIVAGEYVGYIAIYHDIGEIQLARRTAEAANQAKSAFLANMSHELRTPLNAILGFTQLMDSDPNLTAEQQENLGIINRSGEHLLTLINDVLEMSKIEAGRVTLQEKSFDLYRLLDTMEEMFRLRAEGKGLALSFERAENVPQYVRMDEGKLRQVLMNLLGNAVKFTEEGGLASRVRRAIEAQRLIFEVEDTGPGIAPEELEAVFEPFVQTVSGQRSVEGTGLGLSISRQFARLMGGDITVSSKIGQGSVFRFEVPIGLAEAAKVEAAQPSRRVLGLEPGQPIYRLLIVDDRETTRRLLVRLLEPLGFEVREAIHGQEAIEVWESWEPHLIWMDMRMPVMDGYEASRQIKATTKGQATVIVALTASAFEEDRETILSAGCDDIVRKPFRKEEIFDRLAKHLGVRFIFDEEPAQPTMPPSADVQGMLTPEVLGALPPGWLSELRQATIKANLTLILTLIDQIREQNEALANALAGLAHDFEYKKILTLIE